jgi:hypothetical protein
MQDKAGALAAMNYFWFASGPQYRQTVILVERSDLTRPITYSPSEYAEQLGENSIMGDIVTD